MSEDRLIDVRTPLAVSEHMRVEQGSDGTLYLITPFATLHLDRDLCEELATTVARSVLRLRKLDAASARPALRVIAGQGSEQLSEPARSPGAHLTQCATLQQSDQ